MKEIFRLAMFEWKQTDLRSILNGLWACLSPAVFFFYLQQLQLMVTE